MGLSGLSARLVSSWPCIMALRSPPSAIKNIRKKLGKVTRRARVIDYAKDDFADDHKSMMSLLTRSAKVRSSLPEIAQTRRSVFFDRLGFLAQNIFCPGDAFFSPQEVKFAIPKSAKRHRVFKTAYRAGRYKAVIDSMLLPRPDVEAPVR